MGIVKDGGAKCSLPWPDKRLSPNARQHRMAIAPLRRKARESAAWACKAANMNLSHMAEVGIHLRITFHPPDRRRRDLDNMLSSIKSQLDGISDVIGVDDSKWDLTLRRGDPVKGGCVVVDVIDDRSTAIKGVVRE